jgi:hypothetical protein
MRASRGRVARYQGAVVEDGRLLLIRYRDHVSRGASAATAFWKGCEV